MIVNQCRSRWRIVSDALVAALGALLAGCSSGGGSGSQGNGLPLEIRDVLAVPFAGTRATVTWATNVPASSRVEYGPTTAYGSVVDPGGPLTRAHSVELDLLGQGVDYHFRVLSMDAGGAVEASGDVPFTSVSPDGRVVSGSLRALQPLEISFPGPSYTELDQSPNPFLFQRLVLEFTAPSGAHLLVPGYFAGDGQGGGSGNIWRVAFAPDESGTWSYVVHSHEGADLAVELDLTQGTPSFLDGATGTLPIVERDPAADGFYQWGPLEYVGGHYLKFRQGPYFIKGGTDSPENLLGYKGFDNTFDQPGGVGTFGLENGVHRYLPHEGDFGPAGLGDALDPLFVSADTGHDSRGLIGALDYLASRHVNSVYFLPMNLGGDGRETYPFVGPGLTAFDKTHYDISKLHQWNQVFRHAQRRGILLHFVLAETEVENETHLDGGLFGVERKLFFRELVARFGHCPAIKWNLSEENDFPVPTLRAMAAYLRALEPFDHPVAVHTHPNNFSDYFQLLGSSDFASTSIQYDPDQAGAHVEEWRMRSAAAGQPWVLDMDENGGGLFDSNADDLRRRVLYDVTFSGGQIEWYFGYNDLPLGGDMRTEDFRTREAMWDFMWFARRLLESMPFWEMEPHDELLTGESGDFGGGEVFAKPGECYALYLPATQSTGTLDLGATAGDFSLAWYNPRSGAFEGAPVPIAGGALIALGPPPGGGGAGEDWVVRIAR